MSISMLGTCPTSSLNVKGVSLTVRMSWVLRSGEDVTATKMGCSIAGDTETEAADSLEAMA